jgi:hypothetical protein
MANVKVAIVSDSLQEFATILNETMLVVRSSLEHREPLSLQVKGGHTRATVQVTHPKVKKSRPEKRDRGSDHG